MLNPLIFRLLDRWQARQDASEQAQQARDADAALAEDAATHQVPAEVTDHAIVVGYGRVGNQLAALLKARGVPVVVVEGDADRVANAREAGFPAVRGNIASEKVMLEAKPERATMAVLAIPHPLEDGEADARAKVLHSTFNHPASATRSTQPRDHNVVRAGK